MLHGDSDPAATGNKHCHVCMHIQGSSHREPKTQDFIGAGKSRAPTRRPHLTLSVSSRSRRHRWRRGQRLSGGWPCFRPRPSQRSEQPSPAPAWPPLPHPRAERGCLLGDSLQSGRSTRRGLMLNWLWARPAWTPRSPSCPSCRQGLEATCHGVSSHRQRRTTHRSRCRTTSPSCRPRWRTPRWHPSPPACRPAAAAASNH
mmetsp:Transcript_21754/g.55465  ORF Transcript_21754/g.55465 Transcript_21754/m.55465 type:complete len:201 (-) Transcript_21754:673-1275(-)